MEGLLSTGLTMFSFIGGKHIFVASSNTPVAYAETFELHAHITQLYLIVYLGDSVII